MAEITIESADGSRQRFRSARSASPSGARATATSSCPTSGSRATTRRSAATGGELLPGRPRQQERHPAQRRARGRRAAAAPRRRDHAGRAPPHLLRRRRARSEEDEPAPEGTRIFSARELSDIKTKPTIDPEELHRQNRVLDGAAARPPSALLEHRPLPELFDDDPRTCSSRRCPPSAAPSCCWRASRRSRWSRPRAAGRASRSTKRQPLHRPPGAGGRGRRCSSRTSSRTRPSAPRTASSPPASAPPCARRCGSRPRDGGSRTR